MFNCFFVSANNLKNIHQVGIKVGFNCGSVLKDGLIPDMDHKSRIIFAIFPVLAVGKYWVFSGTACLVYVITVSFRSPNNRTHPEDQLHPNAKFEFNLKSHF